LFYCLSVKCLKFFNNVHKQSSAKVCVVMSISSHVDDADQPLVFLVTEKRERDVVGQIVVPLFNIDDTRSTEPLRVPLQPGPRCPQLVTSPGELLYSVWTTTEESGATLRTSSSLSRLRQRLNNSPSPSSNASRWNEMKSRRRHSMDVLLDLHSGASPHLCQPISFDTDSSPISTIAGADNFIPITSPDGYVKRSSLPTVFEQYFARPQILEVCPCEGPTAGGTVVTVRGRDLGLSRDDVVGLMICGSDVLDSLRYISSQRLVCTTAAWKPCVGCVTVETSSGGRVSSSTQFTFTADTGSSQPRPQPRLSAPQLGYRIQTPSKSQWRRFSLSALEDVERPHQTQLSDDVIRCPHDRHQAPADLTTSSSVTENHPALTTSGDITRPPTQLPQIKNDKPWKHNDEEVSFV